MELFLRTTILLLLVSRFVHLLSHDVSISLTIIPSDVSQSHFYASFDHWVSHFLTSLAFLHFPKNLTYPSNNRFIVFDYASRFTIAEKDLLEWIGQGKIKIRETKLEGLESCPRGLIGLFKGENTGKLVIKINHGSAESKL